MSSKFKKRTFFLAALCILFAVVISVFSYFSYVLYCENKIHDFSIHKFNEIDPFSSYEEIVESFPSNLNLGEIKNAKDAVKAADFIWDNYFDKDFLSKLKDHPFKVYYDSQEDIWFVTGSDLPKNMKGGPPCVFIAGNGDVIALWHYA